MQAQPIRAALAGALALAVGLDASASAQDLVVNGSFENTTVSGCSYNHDNASFTAVMAFATGNGTAEEIDIIETTTCSSAIFNFPAIDGRFKVGLHQRTQPGLPVDGFALDLASPTIAGQAYDLVFHASAQGGSPLGPVEIGLSAIPTDFGTLVASEVPTSSTSWDRFELTVVAPLAASYLTVRQSTVTNSYTFVDGFELAASFCATSFPAAEVVRRGTPPNPDQLRPAATLGPFVGATWDPYVDHVTWFPTALVDFLAVTVNAVNLPTSFGTLLVDLTGPTLLQPVAAGAPFAVPIPPDCSLLGVTFATQAAASDGFVHVLTNALDVTIGTF